MCNHLGGSFVVGRFTTGRAGAAGNAVDRLCDSLDIPENRQEFTANEEAYCLRFGLDRQQRQAIRERDFLRLLDFGAHTTQLDKLAAL